MRSNLLIKKFDTEPVVGTKTAKEVKSIFGGKLIDVEDEIYINNISIQYSDVVSSGDINHYQNFDKNSLTYPETKTVKSLDDLKKENHSVDIYSQTQKQNQNFEWIFVVDTKNILKQYLFLRLKEARTFKCIKNSELTEKNINEFIYDYIEINLLNRYNLSKIDFYAEYFNVIEQSNLYDKNTLLKNPNYNKSVFAEQNKNKISNINIITTDYLSNLGSVKMIFNQTKSYTEYKFDYYFTLNYKKI